METPFTVLRIVDERPISPAPWSLSDEEAERRLWKSAAAIRFYREVETACHVMLATSAIGAVLYGVAVLLYPS